MSEGNKHYLGDSVYAEFDGCGIKLTVEKGDGIARETIYIEPETFEALIDLVRRLNNDSKKES